MDMKRHYYEDVQLFTSGVIVFWFCALIVFLALFPFLFKNYYVYVANYMAINVIVVIGLNLVVGYTGQISLGHAGFFAIGAYGTLTLMIRGMATGQVSAANTRALLRKELAVGMLNGILFSIVIAAIAMLWYDDVPLGLVMAAAILLNLLAGALAGLIHGKRAIGVKPVEGIRLQ